MADSLISLSIAIADIEVGDRIGFYDRELADALGALISIDGQHTPILVRKNGNRAAAPYTLIDGLHRLRGCEMHLLPVILAVEVASSKSTPTEMVEMEASANLHRREMRPLERSRFANALSNAVQQRQDVDLCGERPVDRAIRARWEQSGRDPAAKSPEIIAEIQADSTLALEGQRVGLTQASCSALGLSHRQLRKLLAIYNGLTAPFAVEAEALNRHPLCANINELERVACSSEEHRRKIVRVLLDRPELQTWDAVRVAAGVHNSRGCRMSGADKHSHYFLRHWKGMKLGPQRAAFRQLVAVMTPGQRQMARELLIDVEATDA